MEEGNGEFECIMECEKAMNTFPNISQGLTEDKVGW